MAELFTGFNPQQPAKQFSDPIVLEPVTDIPGELGEPVRTLIDSMLVMEAENRRSARMLLSAFHDLFMSGVRRDRRRKIKPFTSLPSSSDDGNAEVGLSASGE